MRSVQAMSGYEVHTPTPQLRLKACLTCRCVISGSGLCSYGCPEDASTAKGRKFVTHVYRYDRTIGLPKAAGAKEEEGEE